MKHKGIEKTGFLPAGPKTPVTAAALGTGFLMLAGFLHRGNKDVQISEYAFVSRRLPDSFRNFRITQVSDLQSQAFGPGQADILDNVAKTRPDIIVVTGDLVDRNHTDFPLALETMEGLVKIAPVYYVNGNHELSLPRDSIRNMYRAMKKMGVRILRNRFALVEKDGEKIVIAGIAQEAIYRAYRASLKSKEKMKSRAQETGRGSEARDNDRTKEEHLAKRLKRVYRKGKGLPEDMTEQDIREHFTVMLTHCPQYIDTYALMGPDLIFAGHAHGGQFRLPSGQGILAPGQGLLPKYTEGFYRSKESTMMVSRGLGNSIFPVRLNNKPEIVVVELRKE